MKHVFFVPDELWLPVGLSSASPCLGGGALGETKVGRLRDCAYVHTRARVCVFCGVGGTEG